MNYLDNHKLMNMLARDVRMHHIHSMLKPYWKPKRSGGKPGTAYHLRNILHMTFDREIDLERYSHNNPAPWRGKSQLSRRLGERPPVKHFADVQVADIPHIVAHLMSPTKQRRRPDYLTIPEAAYAWERGEKVIRALMRPPRSRFPGRRKDTDAFDGRADRNWLLPINELKEALGEPVHEPMLFEHDDVILKNRVLLLIIITAMRPGMACALRWDQIKQWKYNGKAYDIIEYEGETADADSEHKVADDSYIVMITPGVRALLDVAREHQRQQDIKSKFVFVHSKTRAGGDFFYGKIVNQHTVNTHLKRLAKCIPEVKKKVVTVHGVRTAFGTWMSEEKGVDFDSNVVNLTLGHIIAAIRDSRANTSYLRHAKFLEKRFNTSSEWDAFCFSLCNVQPQRKAALRLV